METNFEELEKATKELNEMEKLVLDDHTKETAKELNNFIKTKQRVAILSAKNKQNKQEDELLSPIIKKDIDKKSL